MSRSTIGRLVLLGFALTLILVSAPRDTLASTCHASVDSSLAREEQGEMETRLAFKVDITTSESCARIEYDLVIEERLANGELKKVRKPRVVKLDGGSLTEKVNYRLPKGIKFVRHEAKIVECQKCDLMP